MKKVDESIEILPFIKGGLEVLRTHPWGKGQYFNSNNGAYCAMGAVRLTLRGIKDTDIDLFFEIEEKIQEYLNACIPANEPRSIVHFNDAPHTTKEDVIEVFNCAINKLEGTPTSANL